MIRRDSNSEIVIGMPAWYRVIAWFCLVVFVLFFIVGVLNTLFSGGIVNIWMAIAGFLLTIQGIGMVVSNTKLVFDATKSSITITRGYIPVFLWAQRNKIISKEEANSAFVAFYDSPTLIRKIGNALLNLMLLLPI